MKNTNKLITSLLTVLIASAMMLTTSCSEKQSYTKKTKQTVHVYKQPHTNNIANTDVSVDYIYWYVFYYNNTLYYAKSVQLVSPEEYDKFTWETEPASQFLAEVDVPEIQVNIVENHDLGQQVETTIDTTEAQIADMISEGCPNNADPAGSAESSVDSGSSSSSSDSGGGGDSGGGAD